MHSFGLWILRRWFNQAEVDPAAPVLDAYEAALLRNEVLESMIESLYADAGREGVEFRALVDNYGLGSDVEIGRFVQRLAGFLESLPDPTGWLADASALVASDRARLLEQWAADLDAELEGQTEYCHRAASYIERHLSDFTFYADLLHDAAVVLEGWRDELRQRPQPLERVQAAIGAQKFSAAGAPRLAKDTPAAVLERRDRARDFYGHFHDRLFQSRLQRVFGRYSPEQWFAGLDRIAPYVGIVTRLLDRYRGAYAQAKADAGVLDFSDLERKTYDLLTRHADVAAALRQRFAHVLVDEFQDINPLQEAIIRQVSREPDPEMTDNLFVVGDVKQSIYRFRLAEPEIFLNRERALPGREHSGRCVYLQRNYRSAAHVLDAVNHLFRRLLTRDLGGIEYDADAELHAGLKEDNPAATAASVELHLLQRRWAEERGEEGGLVDPNDPQEWSAIEREAYLIAQRIRAVLREGRRTRDGRPLGFGDVAVLLRAAVHTAAPVAQMLGSLGIPAYADVGGEFFSALEVRDILALLNVLDNLRQDIPLAAVLRSPVLGDALNEDELAALRLIDPDVPFHQTVRRYAEAGSDADLRARVARLVGRLDQYRERVRQRPLAETLWRIYHAHGYLAYIGGLPNGAARRANLLKLHEYARKFGAFQKQGLHRFLRFIEALEEQGQDLDAPAAPATESVVRVMSIHRSKGLEFPVVVVADLGRKFNVRDAAGRLLFDRRLGLGVRVVERTRMIEYSSLAHQLVAGCLNRHTRAEELRVLYVAMTRAMQRLILVGSADLPSLRRTYAVQLGAAGPLSRLTRTMAGAPLDWIVPALATLPPGAVHWQAQEDRDPHGAGAGPSDAASATPPPNSGSVPVFTVHTYTEAEMGGWTLELSAPSSENSARRAAAELRPLPAHEPVDGRTGVVNAVFERLHYLYPHLAAASVPAVLAATELRKRYDWLRDPEERQFDTGAVSARPEDRPTERSWPVAGSGVAPAEAGLITHRVLQHLDLGVGPDPAAIRADLERLVHAGRVARAEVPVVEVDALAWFLGTELGTRMRASGADFRREVMFVLRQPAAAIDPLAFGAGWRGGAEESVGDTVLVRGVIDGILATASAVEIIDYKTDRIAAAEADARGRAYRPQLAAYAAAAEALFGRPVERWWLVFLHARTVVDVRATRTP